MHRISLALASVAVLTLTTAAFGGTTESRYQKLWQKSVSSLSDKPKVGCICLATEELGFLFFSSFGANPQAACGVPSFNPDGSLSFVTGCVGDFIVLPK
jgi:hypothetical protein